MLAFLTQVLKAELPRLGRVEGLRLLEINEFSQGYKGSTLFNFLEWFVMDFHFNPIFGRVGWEG